ncbi:TRAP-type C4-dicarboxylate transport system substrate-binding protein [Humitalea rosea]|uniref:TRAP-type C4-dicarboxylate transport system substrate-binding protein n=1 Tax=Humitalea rosea TaxID=990373 RepID=A0A2W7KDJ3_9PROT|nr:TRAP transporter substrate-binding protein [Humitalea rosea]PZW45682.1 TRAP-type C4-dicarboxylate transport system substrate-binding protein [Humitalea rosea]
MIRRRALLPLAAALAAPALVRPAHAQTVTLRLHHFLPPVANVHRYFLMPWARKVEAESNGALKVQIFPSMQLGGAPPQLFDQAKDGVVDIVWTLPGNTPGRFPRIEVFELPFVAHKRGVPNAKAVQDFAQTHLQEEFSEVHPICVWAHDGGTIHSKREVRRMEDMRGLKLRFPTRQAGEALRALGASPIGMPVPQVPEALSQGVIDGAVVPWEVVPSIRLAELVRFHTEIPGTPTLYTATFILAMNKARYAGLPGELRAVIDANSGQPVAELAGRVWDEQGPPVEAAVRQRGNQIITLSQAETERWQAATRPVVEAWIAASRERGFDGAALLADARGLVAKYGQGVA